MPRDLAGWFQSEASGYRTIVVDCLTLWLSNLIFAGQAARQAEAGAAIDCLLLRDETAALVDTLPRLPGRIILVSNEVGWGIVPMHPVSRIFADEQGRLNQFIAIRTDITERKRDEERLRAANQRYEELNAMLESKVAERTLQRVVSTGTGQPPTYWKRLARLRRAARAMRRSNIVGATAAQFRLGLGRKRFAEGIAARTSG